MLGSILNQSIELIIFLPVKEVRSDHRLSNGGEADRLTALRGPSESYRDVILRLVEAG